MSIRVARVPEKPFIKKLEDWPMPLIRQVGLRGLINVWEQVEDQRVNLIQQQIGTLVKQTSHP